MFIFSELEVCVLGCLNLLWLELINQFFDIERFLNIHSVLFCLIIQGVPQFCILLHWSGKGEGGWLENKCEKQI